MECGSQVTGGYFPDPGFKDMPEPWNLGFPIIEVEEDGSAVITKLPGTGGAVNLMTVKEQIFYEVHDPANYLTPDVVVDFTTTQLEEIGPDRVREVLPHLTLSNAHRAATLAAWKTIAREVAALLRILRLELGPGPFGVPRQFGSLFASFRDLPADDCP